jgi:hypothetical protein
VTLRERLVKLFSPKGGVWLLSPGLGGREEREVIQDLEYYGDRFVQTIRLLEDLSRAYGAADPDLFRNVLREIDQHCVEAEAVHTRIVQRITDHRLFFPGSRTDMFRLLNSMSVALFHMKGFKMLDIPAQPLRETERYLITEIAIAGVKRARTLSDTIRYVNEDPLTALKAIQHGQPCQDDMTGWLEGLRRRGDERPLKEEDLLRFHFLQQMWLVSQDILRSLGHVQEIGIQYL